MTRIGVMLRHIDQHGGGVLGYTHNLLRELPLLDPDTEYFYLIPDKRYRTRIGDNENVREIVVESRSRLTWDQLAVRRAERRYGFDLLFNPKYSLPLSARCKTVFVCHGLDWYVMPWGSKFTDRLSHRYLMPRYASKADGIIAVSNTTREHLIQYLNVSPEKIRSIYHGFDSTFGEPIPHDALSATRQKYQLPERYFLYVGQIYPPKNFGRLLRAYREVGPEAGIHLVVAGEHRWLSGEDLALVSRLKLSDWVHETGWIGRDELPAFYRLSQALLLPSLYESFGLPLLEAMASGCPIVTSARYGTAEIAADAAVLVDPKDVSSIEHGIRQIVVDSDIRERCIRAGYRRVAEFSWKKCASEARDFLHEVAQQP
jgi:glycosyltransferase involved in cell wall biosynthesis